MAGDNDPIPAEYLFTNDNKPGLTAEYFDNMELKGDPAFTRIDKNVDFDWGDAGPEKRI